MKLSPSVLALLVGPLVACASTKARSTDAPMTEVPSDVPDSARVPDPSTGHLLLDASAPSDVVDASTPIVDAGVPPLDAGPRGQPKKPPKPPKPGNPFLDGCPGCGMG